jgi:predicted DNA-binding transcriptional regulator AlpA
MNNRSDWVEMDDVAAMTGLTPDTVRQYRGSKRLPPEDAMVGRTPVWEWSTIQKWNDERNKR